MNRLYRFWALVVSCLILAAFQTESFAQIAIRIEMVQTNYLQYEPVFVNIGLRNYSAHPIAFGEADGLKGTLSFDIERTTGPQRVTVPLLDKNNPVPVKGTIIPPGAVRNLTFDLSKYYDLRTKGRYIVTAVLEHPQLTKAYESNETYFTVTAGIPVWETTLGVPNYVEERAKTEKIEVRKCSIVSYFNGKSKLYVLIIEDKNHVYALKRLGFDMGPNLKPQCEIDFLSRINLMVPASPKVFAYYQYNVDGKLEKKNIYMKTSTTPTLVVDREKGEVMPVGGREARKDLDYEEIKDLPFMENMNTDVKDNDFNDDYFSEIQRASKDREQKERNENTESGESDAAATSLSPER